MSFVDIVAAYGLGALAIMAFMVNIIVELTKNLGILKKVPTSAYAILVSLVLTVIVYFAIIGSFSLGVVWYEFVLTVFSGFITAYIAMFGWSKLNEIWLRFKR